MKLFEQLASLLNYSQQCLVLPIRTFDCRDFWFYCFILFLILCFSIIFFLVKRLLNDKALMLAYQKRKLARSAIADDETMQRHIWQPDSEFESYDEKELAGKMRTELQKKKQRIIEN